MPTAAGVSGQAAASIGFWPSATASGASSSCTTTSTSTRASTARCGRLRRTMDQLSDEWQYWMRQHYYPAVTTATAARDHAAQAHRARDQTDGVSAPGDSAPSFLFFSPASGYTTIYAQNLSGRRRRAVVQGERSEQFESFHFFESRIDVSARASRRSAASTRAGRVVFLGFAESKVVAAISFRSSYRFSRRPGRPMTGAWCSAASRSRVTPISIACGRRH